MTDETPIPYSRHSIDEDDIATVVRVLRGDWLTTGPAVDAFERDLALRGGSRFAVAVNSGTAALHCAYAGAGLGRGDRIVTSPLTFVGTASAAMHLGAEVRFADVDADTGNLSPTATAAALDPRTKLIVPVDYAGHPAAMSELRTIAGRHGLRLVSDAAHSFGAALDGRPVGSLADATATSFHPVKPITTAEGGAVLTDDAEIRRRASEFRSHGMVRDPSRHREPGAAWRYEVQSLGLNYRMPDVLCALGQSQLGKLDRFIARRRAIAARYLDALAADDRLELPVVRNGAEPGWHLFVLRVRDATRRDVLFDHLREHGLGVQVHYLPVHLHPVFQDLGYRTGLCPVAEDFAARAISIPLHPLMDELTVERVVDRVLRAAAELL